MIDGYVYKQTAIDALAKAMPSLTTPDGCGEFDHDIQIADEAFVDSMQIIHGLPSADVQPVRHGHWIEHIYELFPAESTVECSECHEHESIFLINDKYCPNCGAKMDGGQ